MHAILRGIDSAAISFAQADYRALRDALKALVASGSAGVYAYVRTSDHVHLPMTLATGCGPALLISWQAVVNS